MRIEKDVYLLPAWNYLVISQSPKDKPKPGDALTMKVRVENLCALSYVIPHAFSLLFIKA
ncbi:MAG: hypothetical protein ACUVUG_01725 [Candidatus Aminicenantia bacterium]